MRVKLLIEEKDDGKPAAINYPNTTDYLNSIWGDITRHNIKVMADGRQWVIHCLTGEALERRQASPILDTKGNVMWLRAGEKLSPVDLPSLKKWKNPARSLF